MADVNGLQQWALTTWKNEPPEEVKQGVQAAVAANPQASDDEIKSKIIKAVNSAPQGTTGGQTLNGVMKTNPASVKTTSASIQSSPEIAPTSPIVTPDARTALYQKLAEQYNAPELSLEARNKAIKEAESQDMPGWKVNVGAGLKALAGRNPEAFREGITKTNTERVAKATKKIDDQKAGILEDVKSIATLDAAERNAQAADPNSELSAGFRKFAGMIAPNIANNPEFSKLSASQLEKFLPEAAKAYKDQIANQTQLKEIASREKIAKGVQLTEITSAGIRASSAKKDTSEQEKANQMIKYRDAFQKLADLKNMLNENPVAKHVPDILGGKGKDIAQAFEDAVTPLNQIAGSKGMRAGALEHFKRTLGNPQDWRGAPDRVQKAMDRLAAEYINAGGDLGDIQHSTSGTGSEGNTGEVERKTADGKTAVFDANTKQFLRWK